MMEVGKFQVGLLDGRSNWSTWKYKVEVLLRTVPNALSLLKGQLKEPTPPGEGASELEKKKYQTDVEMYTKADSMTLLLLTTNMNEETLHKVMRFNSALEVWQELHRLFDGVSEDKAYDLCMNFFTYEKLLDDDMASHLSELKNLWFKLKLEEKKDENNSQDLLLICKILSTLPEEYFSFKSSWMLMSKSERTVDNLTNQLCAYEKALLKEKNEVYGTLLPVLKLIENTGHNVKEVYCDNGGEFDNSRVKKVVANEGIKLRFTMPYTPEQNGACERENRTVEETARSIMHTRKSLPQVLWAEMINLAVHILNLSGPSNSSNKSPFEVWYGYKKSLKYLRVIDSTCYAHIPKQKRSKMDKKAIKVF